MRKLKVTGKKLFFRLFKVFWPYTIIVYLLQSIIYIKCFPANYTNNLSKSSVLDVENDWESKQDFKPLSSNSDSPVSWKTFWSLHALKFQMSIWNSLFRSIVIYNLSFYLSRPKTLNFCCSQKIVLRHKYFWIVEILAKWC